MNYFELTVSVGGHTFPLFLQHGFFDTIPMGPGLHKHRYTEIHLVAEGVCTYRVGKQILPVKEGEALAIPPEEFHHCIKTEGQAKRTAFQVPIPPKKAGKQYLSRPVTQRILHSIEEGNCDGELSALLALVCAEFLEFPLSLRPLRDPAFLIHEKLANEYYKDLTLEDMARDLGLSKKQTERLIVKHTGHTFRTEISRRRIEAARHLLQTEDLSLSEIAERVGYKSYSGFWKAFKETK